MIREDTKLAKAFKNNVCLVFFNCLLALEETWNRVLINIFCKSRLICQKELPINMSKVSAYKQCLTCSAYMHGN